MQQTYSVYHWTAGMKSALSIAVSGEEWWLQQWQLDHYLKVAEVVAESLDEVFRLTNHIDGDWRDNPEVHVVVVVVEQQPLRSTSVGDVIVQGEVAWLVEPFGFRAIPG